MDLGITRQHLGLLLTIAGTAALAFSIRTLSMYDGERGRAVKQMKRADPSLFEPTETYIVRPLFWGGLILVALGTLMQW